jgi:hypothetical protein
MIVVRDTGYRAKFVMAVGWQRCCGGGVVSSGASHGRLSEKLDVPVIGRYWAVGIKVVIHRKQRLVVFFVIEAEVFSGHLQSCRGLLSHRCRGDRRHSLGCEMKGMFHASDRRGKKKEKDVERGNLSQYITENNRDTLRT